MTSASLQRILTIARLTFRAAFRFKLIPWLCLLLGLAIGLIPYFIRHDGTAQMFAQVQLSYSLMTTSILLAAATIWLSCGILAQDLEKRHITLLVSKPVARWELWLGRWIGIGALNTLLLGIAGAGILSQLSWHAKNLSVEEQLKLRQSVLTSRASHLEPFPDEEAEVQRLFEKRQEQVSYESLDVALVKERLRQEVQWMNQLVQPLRMRQWQVPVRGSSSLKEGDTLQLRAKFYAPPDTSKQTYRMTWIVGNPVSPQRFEKELDLAPMATHEWSVPASLIDADGMLRVECRNYSDQSLIFKPEDGLEVLSKDGTFLFNFFKGLAVLLAWMGLLAAMGLWAATFASLPVATFLILTVLMVTSSDSLFRSIVSEGTISSVDEHTGRASWDYLDWFMVPIFTLLHHFTETLRSIAPIDRLVTGRSIPFAALITHILLVIGFLGGSLMGLGMLFLTRKELDQR
jgi:hypothetical protein